MSLKLVGFLRSIGLCRQAETAILLFPLMINKQLQGVFVWLLFQTISSALFVCRDVYSSMWLHWLSRAATVCPVVVSSPGTVSEEAQPCELRHCFQIKACLSGSWASSCRTLRGKKEPFPMDWKEMIYLQQNVPSPAPFPFSNEMRKLLFKFKSCKLIIRWCSAAKSLRA